MKTLGRGRRVAFSLFLLGLPVLVASSIGWRSIAAEFRLLGFRSHPQRMVQVVESSKEGSVDWLAVRKFLRSDEGKTALFDLFFEHLWGVYMPADDLQTMLKEADVVAIWFDVDGWSYEFAGKSSQSLLICENVRAASLESLWYLLGEYCDAGFTSRKLAPFRFQFVPAKQAVNAIRRANAAHRHPTSLTTAGSVCLGTRASRD